MWLIGLTWKKSHKKIDVWQGSATSMGGGKFLIAASLTNSPVYHMSMFLLPKTVVKRMEKNSRKFFWQGNSKKRKYYLVKWSKVCKSKKKGGLGIKNLRKMNISLLIKWWWKLENEDGLWQDIVKAKYLRAGRGGGGAGSSDMH